MKIAVVGTGYVGLVTGTCFADSGNEVTCIDIDEEKIAALRRGEMPIYEPGLTELVKRNAAAGRLQFTTDLPSAVKSARLVYLAVGTPTNAVKGDGSADLSALWNVVEQIAPHLAADAIVVTKSTVPVGTNAGIFRRLKELTGRECDVASNPEFLKEGAAIEDFTRPDRVVVGVRRAEVADVLHELYAPFLRNENPFLVMSPESAELTKYAANAMLATKISFINEMANICERVGGDINDVRRGIGHDARIGFKFLFPGVGYGGSCFPKDVRELAYKSRSVEHEPSILNAVIETNERQKHVLESKLAGHFQQGLADRVIAIWGLAFKPRTDDIREAPALVLIDWLLSQGAKLQVYDPAAMENVCRRHGERLTYAASDMQALEGADALVIMTEWPEFRNPDFEKMRTLLREPVVFDGRNLYSLEQMREDGFTYYSIGRPVVRQV